MGMIAQEHVDMVADCAARESKLDAWESTFIESINDRLDSQQSLTAKQVEKLEQIWEKVTKSG